MGGEAPREEGGGSGGIPPNGRRAWLPRSRAKRGEESPPTPLLAGALLVALSLARQSNILPIFRAAYLGHHMSEKEMKMPVVASVINLKGGVGKTTIVALLSRYAARCGLKVLAVDLDPQANLSQALMNLLEYKQFMEGGEPSIVELFNGITPPSKDKPAPSPLKAEEVVKKINERLYLLPSRFDFSHHLIGSVKPDERILARFIGQDMQDMDIILIDCAPTESILTRTAYHASRHIIVPVRSEFFSTIGFPLLKESLEKFRQENRGHKIDVLGILINMTRTSGSWPGPHHASSVKEVRDTARKNGWHIYQNKMYHSDGYPKMMREQYASYTGNAKKDFPPIAKEILQSLGFDLQ